MIRKVVVKRFQKLDRLEFELKERTLVAGPNNSGKTTLLQALATWSELGEIWLDSGADMTRRTDGGFPRIELDIVALGASPLSRFDALWRNQETREPISIRVTTDDWDVGFEMRYQRPTIATIGPLAEISEDHLEHYAKNPLRALYIPSLSGMDRHEPKYDERVVAARLAHGKGGMVIRNMVQAVSRDRAKWMELQNAVNEFFGLELSEPSGVDPIVARYRHSEKEHWYDLINGASGFLQTVLIQSALLHSNAKLFLLDEPDAHLHALLKEKMYRLIRERCEQDRCQAVIATHSGRLIEEAEKEGSLFLVTENGLSHVRQRESKELLKIPTEQIVHAETCKRVLYLEGKSDLDLLRGWAKALDHPAARLLEGTFWIPTAEESGRGFTKKHFRALKARAPALRALEIRDRNGSDAARWRGLAPGDLRTEKESREMPDDFLLAFWTRYEIENYLIHPEAIARFVARSMDEKRAENVRRGIKEYWPPVLIENPFGTTSYDQTKGKTVITEVLAVAGIDAKESEYCRIARIMKPEEIHPDVVAMLDKIESQLPAIEK